MGQLEKWFSFDENRFCGINMKWPVFLKVIHKGKEW